MKKTQRQLENAKDRFKREINNIISDYIVDDMKNASLETLESLKTLARHRFWLVIKLSGELNTHFTIRDRGSR